MYQQVSARGASPVGNIVSLYDTILRDFRRALAAFEAGNVEPRVFELNHSLTVVAHLQSVLDHERGGDAAKRFARFYEVTRGMILEANVKCSREAIEKLIDLYTGMRQAWHQAEQQPPAAPQQAASATASTPSAQTPAVRTANPPAEADESQRGNWRA